MNDLVGFLRQLVIETALCGFLPEHREWALAAIYGPGTRWHISAGPRPFGDGVTSYVAADSTRISRTWDCLWGKS